MPWAGRYLVSLEQWLHEVSGHIEWPLPPNWQQTTDSCSYCPCYERKNSGLKTIALFQAISVTDFHPSARSIS